MAYEFEQNSSVEDTLASRLHYPEAIGIYAPDNFLFKARFGRALEEKERQATINHLLANPYELTYQCSLPLALLENIYPGLRAGIYLPEKIPAPRESTQRTLKYFGASDDETLLNRTKNIVRQTFSLLPEAGEMVNSTLDYVNSMHGNQRRRTGETRISHEARILLRTLSDAFIYHDILDKATEMKFEGKHYELSGRRLYIGGHHLDLLTPHNLPRFATRLCAILLHDILEDYKNQIIPPIMTDPINPNILVLSDRNGGHNKKIYFNDARQVREIIHIVQAFTNEEEKEKYMSPDEFAADIEERLLLSQDPSEDHDDIFSNWAIKTGKANDREDNISLLWKHKHSSGDEDRYLLKLIETMSYYQIITLMSYMSKHIPEILFNLAKPILNPRAIAQKGQEIQDVPRATAISLLKMLGATDDEIFDWTDSGYAQQLMEKYEKEKKEPIMVPGPTQTMIILNDGTYQIISRKDNYVYGRFNHIIERHLQKLDEIAV